MKAVNKGKIRVLVTAIGGPTGYGVVKCLEDKEDIYLIGVDSDKNCHSANKCDIFCVVPKIKSNKFLDEIKRIIKKFNVDIVIPTLQDELYIFEKLKEQVEVITGSSGLSIDKLLDKVEIYNMMKKKNLIELVPKYELINDIFEYKIKLKELGYPEKKVCIKPVNGHGGIGFKVIANLKEVANNFFNKQFNNLITSDEFERILSVSFHEPFMLMEYLPGDEFSVDLLAKDSELVVAIPRKRERVSNGIVISGKIEKKEILIQAANYIVKAFGLNNFVNLQFRFDELGNPKLIDLNPRFCGSQIMSLGAGVNFPYLNIKMLMGKKIDHIQPNWDISMTRYWESYFYETKVNKH